MIGSLAGGAIGFFVKSKTTILDEAQKVLIQEEYLRLVDTEKEERRADQAAGKAEMENFMAMAEAARLAERQEHLAAVEAARMEEREYRMAQRMEDGARYEALTAKLQSDYRAALSLGRFMFCKFKLIRFLTVQDHVSTVVMVIAVLVLLLGGALVVYLIKKLRRTRPSQSPVTMIGPPIPDSVLVSRIPRLAPSSSPVEKPNSPLASSPMTFSQELHDISPNVSSSSKSHHSRGDTQTSPSSSPTLAGGSLIPADVTIKTTRRDGNPLPNALEVLKSPPSSMAPHPSSSQSIGATPEPWPLHPRVMYDASSLEDTVSSGSVHSSPSSPIPTTPEPSLTPSLAPPSPTDSSFVEDTGGPTSRFVTPDSSPGCSVSASASPRSPLMEIQTNQANANSGSASPALDGVPVIPLKNRLKLWQNREVKATTNRTKIPPPRMSLKEIPAFAGAGAGSSLLPPIPLLTIRGGPRTRTTSSPVL